MNKKFFSALVMGSLLLGGTVVSCSDYDDDITNLQEQIDKLASAADLESKANQLASQIQSAQAAAEAKAAAAQSVADAAKAAAGNAQTSADAAQATADAAQAAADAVRKTAEELASDLTATKEAVATAQAAADAAQAAADAAQAAADSKATPEDVAAAVAAAVEAQAATDAAQNTKLEELAAAIEAVKTEIAEAKTEEALKAINEKLAALGTQVADLAGVKAMVTSISLVEAFHYSPYNSQQVDSWEKFKATQNQGYLLASGGNVLDLGFMAVSEQTTKFGPKGELEFTEGSAHSLQTSTIVVRVNPANATFEKEDVCLVDSKGRVLEVLEIAGVKPYDELIGIKRTRGAETNTGLWKIDVQMKEDVSMEDLIAATTDVVNKDTVDVCYAVSIGDAERNVVSTYDIVAAPAPYVPAKDLDFFASNKDDEFLNIKDIHNRFESAEDGTETKKEELVWYAAEEKSVVPAIAEQIYKETKADKKQYQNVAQGDNRQTVKTLLPVEVNKPIELHLLWDEDNTAVVNRIAGFYVSLDERNAVESEPSEINAWKSYKYEKLNEVQPGNTGSITITSEEANGDVIGFRVFAVNLDGTLVDPDGRAFYVYVGDATKIGTVPTQTIKAVEAEGSKTTANFLADFKEALSGVKNAALNASGWTNTKAPVVKDKNGKEIDLGDAPTFEVWITDKDGNDVEVTAERIVSIDFSKAKKVWYVMPTATDFVDGGTYEQQMEITKTVGKGESSTEVLVKTITVSFTKVMPSEAPKITYITGQTGELLLAPVANPTELADFGADEIADEAAINLNNVYYQLSRADEGSLLFSVDNSAWVNNKGYVDPVEGQNAAAKTALTVKNEDDEEFAAITNGSAHTIKFAGYYTNVSYAYDAEADEMVKDDFVTKETTNFDVTYNCWDKFTKWSWNTVKYDSIDTQAGKFVINADAKKNVNQFKPELQWTTAGETITWIGDVLKAANTKNPEIFNASIADYLNDGVIVVAEAEDIFLEDVVDPEQINSYFVPAVNGDKIEFTMAQNSSNPAADVKQLLKVKFTDVFGHEVTLTLGEVTILRQK